MYSVTKTYGHERGLSACFRQHRAVHSHCSMLHGYALAFSFRFEAEKLDERNWVIDFGDLDDLKADLEDTFDHTLVAASDDPMLAEFRELSFKGLVRLKIMDAVGCEAFARYGLVTANNILKRKGLRDRVTCVECTVSEHGANSASYETICFTPEA